MQLGALLRVRRLVGEDPESRVLSKLSAHPSYLALVSAVESYLDDVDRVFVPGRARADESDGESRVDDAHARLMDYMLYT